MNPSCITTRICDGCKHEVAAKAICRRCGTGPVSAVAPPMIAPQKAAEKPTKNGKKRGEMNGLERRFLGEYLRNTWTIETVLYEPITFRILGGSRRYTPDFLAIHASGSMHAYEVKGPWQSRDARLRWEAARQEYPWISWHWATWNEDRREWVVE